MSAAVAERRHVILAEGEDHGAARVAAALAAATGPGGVRLLSATEVVFAHRLVLTIEHGRASTELELADGDITLSATPRSVLCRAAGAMPAWAARASPANAAYASSEAHAVLLAWLASLLCPVLNRPSGRGLAGPALTPVQWLGRAAQAGLPCVGIRRTTNVRDLGIPGWIAFDPGGSLRPGPPVGRSAALLCEPGSGDTGTALLAGDRVLGQLPSRLHSAFRCLGEATGCRVLALQLVRVQGRTRVAAVDPVPPLDRPGEAEAVAALMQAIAESRAVAA